MIIQCTQHLVKDIGLSNQDLKESHGYEQFPHNFFAWHAHLIRINRRKTVVLMNNATRYPIVLYGMRKPDFAQLDQHILAAIKEAWQLEGIHENVIKTYLNEIEKVQYSKTANQQMVAWLNRTVQEVEAMNNALDADVINQRYLNLAASRFIQKFSGSANYYYPYEKLYEKMLLLDKSVHGETRSNILNVEHYVLKIQLMTDQHEIWRRVSVPSVLSFRHLHNIIQTVFDWQNYHLHDFTIIRENRKQMLIVMDKDEVIDFIDQAKFDIKEDSSLSLKEVMADAMEIIYEYDFGDSWEHLITLEKTEKVPQLQAMYIDGEGERPPEDIGGISGFDNYLQIIADESHPDHQAIKMWAEKQKERKQTSEQINRRLKNITSPMGFSDLIF